MTTAQLRNATVRAILASSPVVVSFDTEDGLLLVRRGVGPGEDDLGLHRRAVRGAINAQALGLRGKKPADRGGSIRGVLAIRLRRRGSAPVAVRGRPRP